MVRPHDPRRRILSFSSLFRCTAIAGIVLVAAVGTSGQDATGLRTVRGIHPEKLGEFQGSTITCDTTEAGHGKSIPIERVNDDYCDCDDGSDEPGTSACSDVSPASTFFCPNVGHVAIDIHSSKVNDGVCDCCDGSDEWMGDHCKHSSCRQFALDLLKHDQAALEQLESGLQSRRDYEHKGQSAAEVWVSELAAKTADALLFKAEAKKLRKELRSARPPSPPPPPPPEVEDPDKLDGMEGREEAVFEAVTEFVAKLDYENPAQEFDHLDAEKLVAYVKAACPDLDLNKQRVQDRVERIAWDIMDPTPPEEEEVTAEEGEEEGEEPAWKQAEREADEEEGEEGWNEGVGEEEETEEERKEKEEEEEDEEFEREWEKPTKSPPVKGSLSYYLNQAWDATVGPYYDEYFKTDYDKLFKRLEKLKRDKEDSEKAAQEIRGHMARDYGAKKQYYALYGQCYEEPIQGYSYTVCPYDKVEQKALGGSTSFSIGRYSRWEEPREGAQEAHVMLFSGGDRCPARNREGMVLMACGSVNKIITVQETSQCQYEITFVTPAACTESAVEELRKRVAEREAMIAKIDASPEQPRSEL